MMRATIKVRMRSGEPWRPGLLTTERAESSYGLPVVIVKGTAYGAAEVWSIHVSPRAPPPPGPRATGWNECRQNQDAAPHGDGGAAAGGGGAMIAAIYARKSTDQNLPDAEKSVTRQVEHATAYATRKGWTVDPTHVYQTTGSPALSS